MKRSRIHCQWYWDHVIKFWAKCGQNSHHLARKNRKGLLMQFSKCW